MLKNRTKDVIGRVCSVALVVLVVLTLVSTVAGAYYPPQSDIDLLAKVIYCEMGSSWIPDAQLYNVGSVVVNRIRDNRFPNTLSGVIYQKGQYWCAYHGLSKAKPSERCYIIARDLLINGSKLPAKVVFQANFRQGKGTYATYYDKVLRTTTYYCY